MRISLFFRFSTRLLKISKTMSDELLNLNANSAGRRCLSSTILATTISHTPKIIGTHDGNFHCDEVLACVMLKKLPQYSNAEIIRTRDKELLKTCDVVVDVGDVFDPPSNRFDHHQKSFQESMSTLVPNKPWKTRLSSAGLVYVHFGREVLANMLEMETDDEGLDKLYDKIYEDFIEEIDAIDNGIQQNDEPMRYKITTNLSNRVSFLNPGWKIEKPDYWSAFQKAMHLVDEEFKDRVNYYANDWLESYNVVRDAVNARFEVDPSGQIIEFPAGGVPWKDHLMKLEKSLEIEKPIQFVIFPDLAKGAWRVQAVPIEPKSFICRTPLKKEWRGLRDKELEEMFSKDIPTIQFVHATGFIGGAREHECVIKMARESLRAHKAAELGVDYRMS